MENEKKGAAISRPQRLLDTQLFYRYLRNLLAVISANNNSKKRAGGKQPGLKNTSQYPPVSPENLAGAMFMPYSV